MYINSVDWTCSVFRDGFNSNLEQRGGEKAGLAKKVPLMRSVNVRFADTANNRNKIDCLRKSIPPYLKF